MKGFLSAIRFLLFGFHVTLGHYGNGRSGDGPPSWETARRFEKVKNSECFKQFGGFCLSGCPDYHVERFLEQVTTGLVSASKVFLCPKEKYQSHPDKCCSGCAGVCYHRHQQIGIEGGAVALRFGEADVFVGSCSTSCDLAENLRPLPLTVAGGASTVVHSTCDPAGCSCCGLACSNTPLCQDRGGVCHPVEEQCPGAYVNASANVLESFSLCSRAPSTGYWHPTSSTTPPPTATTPEPADTHTCRCCVTCSGKCAYLGAGQRHGSQYKKVIVSGTCRKECKYSEYTAYDVDVMASSDCSSGVCQCCGNRESLTSFIGIR